MSRPEEYLSLRSHILELAELHLREHLKTFSLNNFRSVINSNRRTSYIQNFNDLLKILEKRGHVSEHYIEPLRSIVNLLPNPTVTNEIMDNYLYSLRDRNRSRGALQSNFASIGHFPVGSDTSRSSNTTSNNCGTLPDRVVDLVCRDIGTHWRDLARNLSIREGDIDEIEILYPRQLKERAYECMKRFQKETDPYKVRQKLVDALEKCGRRDLKEEVEEILNRKAQ